MIFYMHYHIDMMTQGTVIIAPVNRTCRNQEVIGKQIGSLPKQAQTEVVITTLYTMAGNKNL